MLEIILIMIGSPFVFYMLLTICERRINKKYNSTNIKEQENW